MAKIPLTAVTYRRVSTDEQTNNTSLAEQRGKCREKAEALGATVVEELADEGLSGGLFLARPGLQRALALIESGTARLLVCYNLSRLSRDRKHQSTIKDLVEDVGGRLAFVETTFDDTPEGDLMFGIVGGFAHYERQVIRRRTTAGSRKRAEEGIQPSRAWKPYGYDLPTKASVLLGTYEPGLLGRYVVVETEALWVKQMFARFASGESLNSVCRWLNEQAVPTPRDGAFWRKSTVKRILENPAYRGQATYGRTVTRADEGRLAAGFRQGFTIRAAPVENHIVLPCPPLVSGELWEACQRQLVENKTALSGNPSRRFVLGGLLRCPVCGRGMHGSRRERKRKNGLTHTEAFYTCPDARPSRNTGGVVCSGTRHDAAAVEGLVTRAVSEVARRPELAETALRAYQQTTAVGYDPAAYDALCRELAALDARELTTARAQVDALTRGRNAAVYDSILTEIQVQRKGLKARMESLEAQRVAYTAVRPASVAERLTEAMAAVEAALTDPVVSAADKHDLLARVVVGIDPMEEEEGCYRIRLKALPGKDAETVPCISTL